MRFLKELLLFELDQPDNVAKNIRVANDRDYTYVSDKISQSSNVKHLGTGSFGTALDFPNKPNTVIKHGTLTDGYYPYLALVYQKKLYETNPTFPRVYKLKKYKPKSQYGGMDEEYYIAQLEKLTHINDVDKSVLLSVGSRYFNNFTSRLMQRAKLTKAKTPDWWVGDYGFVHAGNQKTKQKTAKIVKRDNRLLTVKIANVHIDPNEVTDSDMFDTMTEFLSSAATHSDQIKDPAFKQAIMIIKNTGTLKKFELDIHGDNVMFRHTPIGPQLVIVDPLAWAS